jgi:hypothetical protein
MSDDSDDNTDKKSTITAELGNLYLSVDGPNEEWVEEQFEKQWQQRLEEAAEMKEAIRRADVSSQ